MKQKRIHLIHRKRSPFSSAETPPPLSLRDISPTGSTSRGRRSLFYPFQLLDLVAQERRVLEFEQL